MMITKKSIGRRTVLRGMGVGVALPLLDAMVPAVTAFQKTPAKPVNRFGAVYVPNGIMMAQWTPKAEGSDFEFTPILKPLESVRQRDHVAPRLRDRFHPSAQRFRGDVQVSPLVLVVTGNAVIAKDQQPVPPPGAPGKQTCRSRGVRKA